MSACLRWPTLSALVSCSLLALGSRVVAGPQSGGVRAPQARPTATVDPMPRGTELADPIRDSVPGELLVSFRNNVPERARRMIRQSFGVRTARTFRRTPVEHWRLPPGADERVAAERLSQAPWSGVLEFAEPNYILHAHDFPADPLRADLWGLHNVAQNGGLADADIDAPEAWQVERGSASVVVAMIDSGIDWDHEDLAAHIWSNPGEIAGNGLDDDNNGFVDDIRGWDFVNDDNDPDDDNGHGTHTAGTVGAVGNNGVGVAGVCWTVTLMPLKFLDGNASGNTADAVAAVDYAASFGVPISNNSWGGGRRSKALERAIQNSSALFVASAGNNGNSNIQYPAGYDLDNILSVAATDNADGLASFSNYGASWVDLGAPGVNTLSCGPGDTYRTISGTSMAAPHVTGTAALLLAQMPGQGASALKSTILGTVDPVASLQGLTVTGGRLNARRAVGASELPPDTIAPADVTDLVVDTGQTTQDTIVLGWTATGDDGVSGTAYAYDLRLSRSSPISDSNPGTAVAGEPLPAAPGAPETLTVGGLNPGTTYYFALRVLDETGNMTAWSNGVSETTTAPPAGSWNVYDIAPGGFYTGFDFAPDGSPIVAYNNNGDGLIYVATWNSGMSAWDIEAADSGSPGISLALDPSTLQPAMSHGWGKLYYLQKGGGSWSKDVVENRANNDVTALVFQAGEPHISYRASGKGGGLKRAWRSGGIWNTEVVAGRTAPKYSDVAFDPAGLPAIAFSDDTTGDGMLNALKVARHDGSGWQVETVDEGGAGYGVFAAIAFDPLTGHPLVAHRGTGVVRFWQYDGAQWNLEVFDPGTQYVFGLSMTCGADGTVHLVYGADHGSGTFPTAATRDPATGNWSTEVIDYQGASPFQLKVRLGPDGNPGACYQGRFALRGSL